MGRPKGICSICGKGKKLSFEHIPPKSAMNDKGATVHTFQDWLDGGESAATMKGGVPQPDGVGYITICEDCNNYSGSHYVPVFGQWVQTGLSMCEALPIQEFDQEKNIQGAKFELKNTRPAPLIKEIVAMLLALNGEHNPDFRIDNPGLVEFVLDKEKRGLPAGYRVYLSLYLGPFCRYSPVIKMVKNDAEPVGTFIDHPPFSYILALNNTSIAGFQDITAYASLGLDERKDVELFLACGFGLTPYPFDFRSRARIAADTAAGQDREVVSVQGVRSDGTVVPLPMRPSK